MLVWAGPAPAVTDADRCEAAKLTIAGKYDFCRLKAEAQAVKTGDPVSYAKCDGIYGLKWGAAETHGGGMCPSDGDASAMRSFITEHTDAVAVALAGGSLPDAAPLPCGNGTIDAGEDCDFGTLNGATCVSEGFVGGTLACGSGCVFDTSGCSSTRFVDNGDGTVSDVATGLMWEKKDDAGGIHDKDDTYSWCADVAPADSACDDDGGPPDGTAFTAFIGTLNDGTSPDGTAVAGCFAGHCDWRLPTSAELQTILLSPFPCGTTPCIDPIFGPTQSDYYWSATTSIDFFEGSPLGAWLVDFGIGYPSSFSKYIDVYVRAIRVGS